MCTMVWLLLIQTLLNVMDIIKWNGILIYGFSVMHCQFIINFNNINWEIIIYYYNSEASAISGQVFNQLCIAYWVFN